MNELKALNNEQWKEEIAKIDNRIADAKKALNETQELLTKTEADYKQALLSDNHEEVKKLQCDIERLKGDINTSLDVVNVLTDSKKDEYDKITIQNVLFMLEEQQANEKEILQDYYNFAEMLKTLVCEYEKLTEKKRQKQQIENEIGSLLKKVNGQLGLNQRYFIDMTSSNHKDWQELIKSKEKTNSYIVDERLKVESDARNLMLVIGEHSGYIR